MPNHRSVSLVALLAGVTLAVGCSAAAPEGLVEPTDQLSAELRGDPVLTLLGQYKNAGGAIEISAYDKRSKRLFSVNSTSVPTQVEVIDIANPAAPVKVGQIFTETGVPNSVAVHKGLVAIAWEAADRYQPGKVTFHDAATLAKLGEVAVGAIPDNITFTKDGDKLLVANEGEPAPDYTFDPEGSVSIIEIGKRHGHYSFSATIVPFLPSTPLVNPESIRIYGGGPPFGPYSTAAQDFEPEYIAISDDGRTAYVTLQENNAIAVLDGSAADDARLGRLTVSTKGFAPGPNGSLKEIYSFGGRSFSVRDKNGNLVFDSGDEIERKIHELLPGYENCDQSASPAPDSRSDNKGPEPEGIALSRIRGTNYAFIGLERVGGVMMYDLDNPAKPRFVTYVNNRNFTDAANPGDLGPEGLLVISKKDSPTRRPILVISNEISGTASFYQIDGGGHGGHDDDCDGEDD